MKRKERKQLYQCNINGLVAMMNDPKYAQNKSAQFADMVAYLSKHGIYGGKTEGELLDMVYAARSELLSQMGQKHMGQAPFPYDEIKGNYTKEEVRRVKDFIRDPIAALKNECRTIATGDDGLEEENDNDKIVFEIRRQENATMLYSELSALRDKGGLYADQNGRYDVMGRLNRKLSGNGIDAEQAYKKLNGNFFTSLFRKPSKEYRKFQEAYEQFSDPHRAGNGNVEDLEKKTTAYLKHIIPEYEYSENMPKKEWLDCLPKGKRGRAAFCLNLIESLNEHKKVKPFLDNVESAINGRPIDPSVDAPLAVNEKLNQVEFQEQLKNEVDPPKDIKADNNIIEENLDLSNNLSK